MRFTGKELLLGLVFAGAAVGVAMMGNRETTPYPYLFDENKATTDQQRFLAAVMRHHKVTEAELQPLTPRLRSVWKDLPMIVWVARQSGKPLQDVAEMRRAGRDWIEIYRELKLPFKPLFEDVPGTAPEPYKAAWTEWRMKYRPEFDNEQMRELAVLQMAREISGEKMDAVLKQIRKGASAEQVIARAAPPSPAASPTAAAGREDEPAGTRKKRAASAAPGRGAGN